MLVSICVSTYQRQHELKCLMDGLNKLTFENIEHPNIEVIIIDNDLAGLACEYCEKIRTDFQWLLKTEIESQRGISYARNRAIAAASEYTNFIAFIDDDEVPEPDWLEQLLLVQQEYDADVVCGPVLPCFQHEDVPNWVKEGKFFEMTRYPTGNPMHFAGTNNALVRAEILKKLDKPFDERFALTGGEDSYLFMRLYQAGYKIVWANEAIAHEWIPQTRTTKKYILQRGYRCWSTHSLIERELYPSIKVQAIRIAKGSGLILMGVILLIPSLFKGEHAFIKALRHIYRGVGTFAGLLGIHYQEYSKN